MSSKLVGMLFDAWDDLDRVIDGLDDEQATGGQPGSSTFAWTVGHLAAYLDFWINVRFGGQRATRPDRRGEVPIRRHRHGRGLGGHCRGRL